MVDTQHINIAEDETSEKLSKKLSALNLKEKEKRVEASAKEQNLPYINLDKFPVSQSALKLIPKSQAEALQTIGFLYTGDEIRVGSLNPTNPQVANLSKELASKHHANVKIYLISENSFNSAFVIYEKIPSIIQLSGINISEEDLNKFEEKLTDFTKLNNLIAKTNLTETINLIIAASLKFSSSDIHIEAEEKNIKIRLRIDGVLHEVAKLPKKDWDKISARMKLLSGLKLNVADKPQDGRFTINMTDEKIDVRVSTIPSAYGESIVMRLLKSSSVGLQFENLGLRGKSFNDLSEEIKKPNGMIMTTGPTGSGKTTTLYAILNKLNTPDTKIITLEDPIEYKLAGIIQSQVEGQADDFITASSGNENQPRIVRYTFAKGLRAILRQDPDVVMVGEIRDLETAETAVNAALTGHLMLSTLHTNSAAATIPRLLAIGVQPFLLAPSLNAIIGQRLIRKLCEHCKIKDDNVDNKTMTTVLNILNKISPKSGHRIDDLSNLTFYKAKGCNKCHNIGYKGRVGLFEILTMTSEIEKIITSTNVSANEIEKIAIDNGMLTMLQDGLLKALDGITSIEEVFEHVLD